MTLRKFAVSAASAAIAVAFSSTAGAAEPPSRGEPSAAASGERRSERRPGEAPEHLRIGALAGLGFPRPFAIEGFAKIEKLVGIGVEYSFLPRMHVVNVDASFKAIAGDLRIFPFKGAFFVGARVGRQWLDAKATVETAQLGSFREGMEAHTWFVNPRIGFLWTFESGITVGVDAGIQLPINPSYERNGSATRAGLSAESVDNTLVAVANGLGNGTTPTVDLLKLGFLF